MICFCFHRSELYDVLVSLNEHRVTVSSHAIDEMRYTANFFISSLELTSSSNLLISSLIRMNSAHKELAVVIEESAANGTSTEVIEAIAAKTADILDKLKSLGQDSGGLTEDIL